MNACACRVGSSGAPRAELLARVPLCVISHVDPDLQLASCYIFYYQTQYERRYTLTYYTHFMNVRTHTPSYEHLRETVSKKFHSTCLEIDEVITDASLSMRPSPPTEEYFVFMRHQSVKPEV
jgi:hypothetical protein